MAPTLINYSQLSKIWKIAIGGGLTLLAASGVVLTLQTKNSSGVATIQEYSDGRRAQSGALVVGSGSKKTRITNAGDVRAETLSGTSLTVTSLRSCDTIDTNASGVLSCGTDATGGGGSATVNTGAILAAGDSRFVNVSGDTMTGNLLVKASISGASLRVSNLKSCDTIDTDVNGNLACGSDATGGGGSTFGSGNVLTILQATDNATSTGALANKFKSIFLASSTGSLETRFNGLYFRTSTGSLKTTFFPQLLVSSTGSLKTFFDQQYLRTSTGSLKAYLRTLDEARYVNTAGDTMTGALKVRANLSGSTLNVDSLVNCDTTDTNAAGRLVCGTDSTGTDTLDDLLDNTTTQLAEGTNLYYISSRTDARYLRLSGGTMTGALLVKDNISGATLRVSNLKNCDTIDTDLNGNLTCGTDATGGGGTFGSGNVITIINSNPSVSLRSSTGSLQTAFDRRYVNTSGDTMTGGLVIQNGTVHTSTAAALLNIRGTASGVDLFATTSIRSSGSLTVRGTVTLQNTVSCTNLQTASNGALSCNNAVYLATSTGSLKTLFDANYFRTSTGSLKTLFDANYLRTSTGSLETRFNSLYFRTSTGALRTQFFNQSDSRYLRRAGGSMTGALAIRVGASVPTAKAGLSLEVYGVSSGSSIRASTYLSSSGALSVQGSVTFTGVPSCAFLLSSGLGVLSCGTLLGISNGGTAQTTLPFKPVVLSAAGATPQTNSGSVAKNVYFSVNQINLQTQDFTSSGGTLKAQRAAQWTTLLPPSYDGGTVTATFQWFTANVAGNIKWFIQCRSYGDLEAVDQAWGTAGSVVDTAPSTANSVAITSATAAVTCSGTPAGGEVVQFRVFRDPRGDAQDTLAGTGRLLNAYVKYRVSSYTD